MPIHTELLLEEDESLINVKPLPRQIQKIKAAKVTVAETSVVHHSNTLDKRAQNTKLPQGLLIDRASHSVMMSAANKRPNPG